MARGNVPAGGARAARVLFSPAEANPYHLAQGPELEVVVRRLRSERDAQAFHVPFIDGFADVAEEIPTGEGSFHASEFETSITSALFPEPVHMDRAANVDPPRSRRRQPTTTRSGRTKWAGR